MQVPIDLKNTKVVVNVAIKIFSVDKNYINHISKKNHIIE